MPTRIVALRVLLLKRTVPGICDIWGNDSVTTTSLMTGNNQRVLQVNAAMGLIQARVAISGLPDGRLRDRLLNEWRLWRVEFERSIADMPMSEAGVGRMAEEDD